jgi:hypothetical protein
LRLVPVHIVEQELTVPVTGFFSFETPKPSYIGIIIGIIIIFSGIIYFLYLKKSKLSEISLLILKKIHETEPYLKENPTESQVIQAEKAYTIIMKEYKNLDEKQKSLIYGKIIEFHKKILFSKINRGLEKLNEKQGEQRQELLNDLKKIYSSLPDNLKKQVKSQELLR